MILGNVHDDHKGRKVVLIRTRRVLAVDFPGYHAKNYADFIVDREPGLTGTVTHVESHGANPWTRYTVRFDDGTRASGLVPGHDFDWRN
jgi:hypothetical protein